MIMMIIFKSKKTETIYCKAFCKDKTKNKKELVTFFEGLDPTNTASAFLLIFYLAECLYLLMFGAIPFINMDNKVHSYSIMLLACLAGALIVLSIVLHSTDINLGTMCKKKCASKGLYEKKNTCKGEAKSSFSSSDWSTLQQKVIRYNDRKTGNARVAPRFLDNPENLVCKKYEAVDGSMNPISHIGIGSSEHGVLKDRNDDPIKLAC